MCCDGVMFHSVRLQPADSARGLFALGLKLKRKKKQYSLLQPCPAHRDCSCAIYADRPTRCRLFVCRLLLRVESGEVAEADAFEMIADARGRVGRMGELLRAAGETNPKRALAQRYEKVMSEPPGGSGVVVREELAETMRGLETLLVEEFRIR